MKKDLLARLKKYAMSAAALTATANIAEAQIQYTDIIPDDTVTGGGSTYDLDLNNDGTIDFNFFIVNTTYSSVSSSTYGFFSYYNQVAGIGVTAANSSNGFLASYSYPYALSNGAPINGSGYFTSSGALYANITSMYNFSFSTYYGGTYAGGNSSTFSLGNWGNAQDKYLGLKLVDGGATYYGWARLTVLNDTTFIIKDYAVQTWPNLPINAGDTFALPPVQAEEVINVVGSDVSNNGNGTDMHVTFNMINDETTISAYRVIVIKEADTLSFDLATAQGLPVANYTTVTPTGSNISINLAAGARDKDGALITDNVPYRVYVMTVADGTNAVLDNLSAMSNHVTLQGAIYPSDPVTSLAATDINDNGNGSDIQVFFAKAANENKVSQYRVIAVKAINAPSFTLAAAQSTPSTAYFSITPNGNIFYTSALSATQNDADGDLITTGIPYRLFVLSKADGTLANTDVMSAQSNSVTLNALMAPDSAQNVTLADIGNNHNGSDLGVSFDKISDETTITEYQIFIVKSAGAASFDIFDAVGNANHKSVSPNGANVSTAMLATSTDSDGDPIAEGVAYKAFILSVANGTTTQISKLSAPSNEVTLLNNIGVEELSAESAYLVKTSASGVEISQKSGLGNISFEVYDSKGTLVNSGKNTNNIVLQNSNYSSGIYLVRIENNSTIETIKVSLD